jgi:magnesium transporter
MVELTKSIILHGAERRWYQVVAPTREEMEALSNDLNISKDYLYDAVDPDELSRCEWIEDGALLAIVRVPFYDPNAEPMHFTAPLGIIMRNSVVLTISMHDCSFLDKAISRRNIISDGSYITYILSVILRVGFEFSKYLKDLKRSTDLTVSQLEKSVRNEELMQLLDISKSLVYIMTSLRANEVLLERLSKMRGIVMSEDELDLYHEATIELREAGQIAQIYSRILNATMETLAGVIGNNLSLVMKRLTSISLLLMWPSLVASIYGMNVDIPYITTRYAFLFIAMATIVIEIMIFVYFKRRDLL